MTPPRDHAPLSATALAKRTDGSQSSSRARWGHTLLEQLRQAVNSAAGADNLVLTTALPADIDPMVAWPTEGPRLRWRSRAGEGSWGRDLVGIGAARIHEVAANGGDFDLDEMQTAVRQWQRRCVTVAEFGAEPRSGASAESAANRLEAAAPLWFGGLAFDPAAEPSVRWREFGRGRFFVPELLFDLSDPSAPILTVVIDLEFADGRSALRRIAGVLGHLSFTTPTRQTTNAPGPLAVSSVASDEADRSYERRVSLALESIRTSTLEKVVLARSKTVGSPSADEVDLLRQLSGRHLDSTVFAIGSGKDLWFGATPERLVAKRGVEVRSEALAGTRRRCDQVDHGAASAKEQREHDLVIGEIVRRLEPHCRSLGVARTVVRTAGPLAHHNTPITAQVRPRRHILDLVASLHPTPAVCGLPTVDARAWIRQHEDLDRGWYSGPIGWFDAEGNGDFAVALRCALRTGGTTNLFAGAGLVDGSDPSDERHEVDLKLRVLCEDPPTTPDTDRVVEPARNLPESLVRTADGSGVPRR